MFLLQNLVMKDSRIQEILLVDEVQAVGDTAFQNKCFDKAREFRRKGKMLLCVSYSRTMIEELCDQVIRRDHGD